jgi:signal transduction histidine kinase
VPELHAVLDVAEQRLPEHIEVALYRIAQEALQNVQKHAGAASTRLIFEVQGDTARLEVRDDGVGFTPEPGRGGYGLNSMAERAELIGGRLTIRSRLGSGTSVIAVVRRPASVG